jgi:hypothetical protein
VISISAVCLILGLIALLLALSGRLTAAVVIGLVALVILLASGAGYLE